MLIQRVNYIQVIDYYTTHGNKVYKKDYENDNMKYKKAYFISWPRLNWSLKDYN